MRDVINIVKWFLVIILFILSCTKKNESALDDWYNNELQGVSLIKESDGWSLLEINYPYSFAIKVDTGFVFDRYFQIDLDIKMMNDTLLTRNNKETQVLFILSEHSENIKSKLYGFNCNSFTVIDTSFLADGERIFQCRFGNIYNKSYTDAILGADLVLYISKAAGIVGMYISKDGEELFNKDYKEVVYYPKGNIFYKDAEPNVKVVK